MKKENVTNDNYINIQGWMVKELNLKGNELLIYAIIYGFSQDGNSSFTGSRQYLADWTNSTKQGVDKNLKSLLEKELIIKEDTIISNLKFCKYSCNLTKLPTSKHSLLLTSKQSLHNNLNNINIISGNNSSINETINTEIENNIDIKEKSKKLSKKQLKEKQEQEETVKINNLIDQFTDNADIQELLEQYIDIRKQKGMLTSAQFMIMLEDLKSECTNDSQIIRCIKNAIAGGWSQIVFIDKFKGKTKTSYSSFDNTAGHFTGNPKISDLDFRFMTFENRKAYISNMAVADMTREQREFFEKYCLARDENGNILEF